MTLYVGIDVSKFKHDLAILENQGEVITKNLCFENSCQGFQILREHLKSLEYPISEILIALEDTGHYGIASLCFFKS